ncbi:hypothetical protein VOLCADRAFT_92252 [Volvox carteri f. nagariensis]|uniref:Uncharacterized protein n=1 Tax=Volvox carteri f. nagariensis TaxID=3068 RepID=D8TZ61_VOLCA|nr:uncharacterized protein VOLCADRAFT_92252 [Volvox carteri f. nagariensis]EFJ47124.1 hypothetical protein VOLCADRAFT_92252 [Volvox carteri f. nagariensis]|eukprot:XP_002951673.1 hypothetical protein VOLCADRAFT_92252 [Volvox carteri f. nagariensis]
MGLTRLAQDPWSESHTVPTFTPPPVEVKSCHVPLTAERAEELVKCHLERTGTGLQRSRDPSNGRAVSDAETVADASTNPPLSGSSIFGYYTPPSLMPFTSSRHLTKGRSTGALLQTRTSAGVPRQPNSFLNEYPSVMQRPAGPNTAAVVSPPGAEAGGGGDGSCAHEAYLSLHNKAERVNALRGKLTGGDGETEDVAVAEDGAGGEVVTRRPPSHRTLEVALADAWMREVEARTPAEDVAMKEEEELAAQRAAADAGGYGAPPAASRRPTRPGSAEAPFSRRLSCPESLINIPGGDGGAASDGGGNRADGVPEPEDALEPLANHHMWMYGRGRMDGGGMGLLYSPAGVLEAIKYGGGWQPRTAVSIFGTDPWATGSPGSGGIVDKGAAPTTRIGKLVQEGAGADAIRTLAAVIIQSYCRGWQARRRFARWRSLQRSEQSRRLKELAAAEALAREQEAVRRRLRAAAKDCLLAIQAQQDYERTRARMAAARGLSGGAAAAAAPPPPAIPTALWERCKALGHDPIEVLLESGLQSHQIEEIISASQLASQLPRRAAAAAARFGIPLPPVPEGSRRPLLPSQRSMGSAAMAAVSKPPYMSTSQLVEQLLAQQQQQATQLQPQQLSYNQYARPGSGSPAAAVTTARRTSGPGALYGSSVVPPQPPGLPLRRQASPSRGSLEISVGQRQGAYAATGFAPLSSRMLSSAVPPVAAVAGGGALSSPGGGDDIGGDVIPGEGGGGDVDTWGAVDGGDGGDGAGFQVPLTAAASAPVSSLSAAPAQQQQLPLQYLPYHLQQQLLASALSSPVTSSSGPQSSLGPSTEGSPALLRRHSFIEHAGGNGGSGGNGGNGSGGGAIPTYLPPLLPSQGSGSAGGSPVTPQSSQQPSLVDGNGRGGDWFRRRSGCGVAFGPDPTQQEQFGTSCVVAYVGGGGGGGAAAAAWAAASSCLPEELPPAALVEPAAVGMKAVVEAGATWSRRGRREQVPLAGRAMSGKSGRQIVGIRDCHRRMWPPPPAATMSLAGRRRPPHRLCPGAPGMPCIHAPMRMSFLTL